MDIIVIVILFLFLYILLRIKIIKENNDIKSKYEIEIDKLKKKQKLKSNELKVKSELLEKKSKNLEKKIDDFYELRSKEMTLFSQKDEEINAEKKNISRAKELLSSEKENQHHNLEKMKNEVLLEKRIILEEISNYNSEEAKKELFSDIEEEFSSIISKKLKAHKEELLLNKKEISKQILIESMEVVAADVTNEFAVKTILIPNDDIKGKLIGREGRNVKALENGLGVNLIIDDTPGQIQISSFNSRRRVVAMICLENLISTARINQTLIEQAIEKAKLEIDEIIVQKGKEALYLFGIEDMDFQLVVEIGSLHLRTSYGQNVLQHSIEAAHIGVSIAKKMGLDESIIARCLLLHDIGKNDSAEKGLSHTEIGYELAVKYNESDIVSNAIRAHHGDVEGESYYAAVTVIADTMSASRLGSRREQYEDFVKRVKELEEIALNIRGVKSAYALQGGRELRVLVAPETISDTKLDILSRRIEKEILEKMVFPGKIMVHIIREKRYTKTIKMVSKIKEQNG